MTRLSSEAKSDLIFAIPREYAATIEQAMRNRGLPSLSAYGRLVILENLRDMGLIDQFFRPPREEVPRVVHDLEDVPVRSGT